MVKKLSRGGGVTCRGVRTDSASGLSEDSFAGKKLPHSIHKLHKKSLGSILIEAVVMMGLIGALTPVLYTHVADRKEEMQNINKANTMLQLQRETEKFLKDDDSRSSITFTSNKATLTPSQIGLSSALDNKYNIGLKKDGNKISAVIVEKEGSGNDVKAAKVANLIGVSAGIKSAMDANNAYGVNGLWKESLANYGLTAANVPAGSTVVTTEYNKEKNNYYTSEMIVDSDIDMGEHELTTKKLTAEQICFGGDCISDWSGLGGDVANTNDTNLVLLTQCMNDRKNGISGSASTYCVLALKNELIVDCKTVMDTYKAAGYNPPTGYYYLGNSWTKKVCFYVDGNLPTSATQIINTCNSSGSDRRFACIYDRQSGSHLAFSSASDRVKYHEGQGYTASCQNIFNANKAYATGYYTLTAATAETHYTNESSNNYTTTSPVWDGRATPCVFVSNTSTAANDPATVVAQCNSGSTAACARGYDSNINRSCEQISNNGVKTSNFYQLTYDGTVKNGEATAWTVVKEEHACHFKNNALAGASDTVTDCNRDKAGSAACGYGYDKSWNRNCEQIVGVSKSFASSSNNTVMSTLKNGSNNQACDVTACSGTSGYCTYNQTSRNKQYCNSTTCGQYCDYEDDSDCTPYNSGYKCISVGGVMTCKSCGASGDTVSIGTRCCSNLYRTSSGTCGSTCGTVGSNAYNLKSNQSVGAKSGSRDCCPADLPVADGDTCFRCTGSGQSSCVSGYHCENNQCVSDCECTTAGWNNCNGTVRRYCDGCKYTSTYDCYNDTYTESYTYSCTESESYSCNPYSCTKKKLNISCYQSSCSGLSGSAQLSCLQGCYTTYTGTCYETCCCQTVSTTCNGTRTKHYSCSGGSCVK